MADPRSSQDTDITRLSLRPALAAVAIGISPRLLAELTKKGVIPHVRVGERVILYPVSALRKWLDEQAEQASKGGMLQ